MQVLWFRWRGEWLQSPCQCGIMVIVGQEEAGIFKMGKTLHTFSTNIHVHFSSQILPPVVSPNKLKSLDNPGWPEPGAQCSHSRSFCNVDSGIKKCGPKNKQEEWDHEVSNPIESGGWENEYEVIFGKIRSMQLEEGISFVVFGTRSVCHSVVKIMWRRVPSMSGGDLVTW